MVLKKCLNKSSNEKMKKKKQQQQNDDEWIVGKHLGASVISTGSASRHETNETPKRTEKTKERVNPNISKKYAYMTSRFYL